MILQIHDELLFEGPAEETDEVSEIAAREMGGAFEMDPPLAVDVGVGPELAGGKVRRATVLAALSGLLLASAQVASAHAVAGVVPDLPNAHVARPPVAHIANLPYGGGPVLHSNRTHLIFWQPTGSGMTFDPGYESLIEQFLGRVAAASHHTDNVYGLTGQYPDAQGPAATRRATAARPS